MIDVAEVKEAIIKTLDELLPEQVSEVWDFTTFLRARAEQAKNSQCESRVSLRLVPATSLFALTGIVSLGGDAVTETEAVYDEDFGNP
jgi:hypothetical protein